MAMITSTHYRTLPTFTARNLPIRLHERPTSDEIVRRIMTASAILAALIAPPTIVYTLFMLGEANFASLPGPVLKLTAVCVCVLLLAALFAKAIFTWLVRLADRHRIITINETQVTVREETLFGTTEWHEPLSGYRGVEREQEATVNGVQQRLVLAHPDRDRQVPVWVGEHIPEALIAGYQSLLSRSARRRARN